MDGHDYEYKVAQYLRNHGYTGVEVTQASGDYGVDVTAYKGHSKYAVQCKYYSKPVGVGAIQEAVAGMAMYDCDKAMVVTNNTFTKAAQNLADKNNVILLDGVTGVGSFGREKIGNTIGWILIAVFALFYGAIINLAFEKGIKDLSEVIAVLLVLPIVLWYFANRIFKFNSLMLKTLLYLGIIAYMSFVGTNIFELGDYLSVGDTSGFIKALSLVLVEVFALVTFLCLPKVVQKIKSTKSNKNAQPYTDEKAEKDEASSEDSDGTDETERYETSTPVQTNEISSSPQEFTFEQENKFDVLIDDASVTDENLEKAISNWIKTVKIPSANPDFSEEKYQREVEEFDKLIKKECDKVASKLVDTFEMFNVKVELVGSWPQTKRMVFMIKPAPGVKISTVKNSLNDVSLRLSVKPFSMTVQSEEGIIYLVTDHKYIAPVYDIYYRFEENLKKVAFESIKAGDISLKFIEKSVSTKHGQRMEIQNFLADNGLIYGKLTQSGIEAEVISEKEFISRYL